MPKLVSVGGRRAALAAGDWTAGDLADATRYFAARLRFEIDCVSLWHILRDGSPCLVLDVRTARSFAAGHIPGARNVAVGALDVHLPAIPSGGCTFVYDAGLGRSEAYLAALRLAQCSRQVQVVSGGLHSWLAEGFEVEVPAIPADRMQAV